MRLSFSVKFFWRGGGGPGSGSGSAGARYVKNIVSGLSLSLILHRH